MNKITILIGIGILILISGCIDNKESKDYLELDNFAVCLAKEDVKFYGSFECPHCDTQKELFGDSQDLLLYVECGSLRTPQNQVCNDNNIEAYPTWVIYGEQYRGVQPLSRLSRLTGCELIEK